MNGKIEWDGEVMARIVQGPIDSVTEGEVISAIKANKLRRRQVFRRL